MEQSRCYVRDSGLESGVTLVSKRSNLVKVMRPLILRREAPDFPGVW